MSSKRDADWGWEAHRRQQLHAAKAMTYAERMRWLVQTNEETARLLGRARDTRRPPSP